jgi:hypothetical protein
MPGYMYVPQPRNAFLDMFTQMVPNMAAQYVGQSFQEKMFEKQQKAYGERAEAALDVEAMKEGRDIVTTGAEKPPEGYFKSPYSTTKYYGPAKEQAPKPVMMGDKFLGYQIGKNLITRKQLGIDPEYLKVNNEIVKVENGKATPLYSAGEKEWKPKTKKEKMDYAKFIANERARAQNKYKIRDPKITTVTDSNGNVTKLVFDKSGVLKDKEDLGPIGRKGSTNIFDMLSGDTPAPPPSEGTGYENGFEGRGMYPVDGVPTQINTQEEYNKILGIAE